MDWQHVYFLYRSPSVDICNGDVSADAAVKGTILALTTQSLTICNGETCRVEAFFYILLHAIRRVHNTIDLFWMNG